MKRFEALLDAFRNVRSLDAAVVGVATRETGPPTPFLKPLAPLDGPASPPSPRTPVGMGFNLWNNIWQVNYPEYYPFAPTGDENQIFRFEIEAM